MDEIMLRNHPGALTQGRPTCGQGLRALRSHRHLSELRSTHARAKTRLWQHRNPQGSLGRGGELRLLP